MKKILAILASLIMVGLMASPANAATTEKEDSDSCTDGNKFLASDVVFVKKDNGTPTDTSDDEIKVKEGTGGLVSSATVNHRDNLHYVEFFWRKLNGSGNPVTVDESGWLQPPSGSSFLYPVPDFGADYVAFDSHPWLRVHARWNNGDQCSFNMAWNSSWE